MNKTNLLLSSLLIVASSLFAQQESSKLSYKFYGFVRADFCYDNRLSASANEGLFYLYPLDVNIPVNSGDGKDLNAVSTSGFYAFNTRAGLDVAGLNVFDADVSAKVEADFAGYSNSSTLLRIRRAFMKMKWEKSSLLIGQDWHPMFGGVFPELLSLNTGAPFNPFNRSPQINYSYELNHVTLSAAALWQFQYASMGPGGKTFAYQKNANVPEFCLTVNYKNKNFVCGALVDYLTLQPRFQSTKEGEIYKVDERLSSFSYGAYVGYTRNLFSVKAKTIVGENLSSMAMLGGFGIKKTDPVTGENEYTNFRHSSTWMDISYGKKYLGNLFAGYTKNLGSCDELASAMVYGEGMNMNALYRLTGTFSYNVPKFTIGLEYEFTTSVYGDKDPVTLEYVRNPSDGLFDNTHNVRSSRILGVICYYF